MYESPHKYAVRTYFLYVHALIKCENMRSKDAQCNTTEWTLGEITGEIFVERGRARMNIGKKKHIYQLIISR